MLFHQYENNIYLKLIFHLPTNHDFGRWKQHLFDILFFSHPRRITLKNWLSCPSFKFHGLIFVLNWKCM